VDGFDQPSFNAQMGLRGIPERNVRRMNATMNEGLRNPQIIKRRAAPGSIPFRSMPEEFTALMRAHRQRWRALVRSSGLQPE